MDNVYRLNHAVTKRQKAIQSEELRKTIAESPRSYGKMLQYIQGERMIALDKRIEKLQEKVIQKAQGIGCLNR